MLVTFKRLLCRQKNVASLVFVQNNTCRPTYEFAGCMQVNTQMVVGTLMNLADEPNVVSTGQNWRSQVPLCTK